MKLDIKKIFKNLSSGNIKRNIIVAVGLIGIILIFISNFTDNKSSDNETEAIAEAAVQTSIESYRDTLESKLAAIVSEIEGAGEVKIMITMESTVEDVYAVEKNIDEQSQSSSDDTKGSEQTEYKEESTYVTIKNKDGSESVVMVKQIMPKIRGVLVVCDGGGNTVVKEKIIQAVSSVLNISSGKIYVTN